MQARRRERAQGADAGRGMAAFESFYRAQYRVVVRLAQSVVGDSQRAQDVAQEVFLAAYRRFPGNYEQAIGWVRVAAVHTSLNVLRGERRRDTRQRLVHVVEQPLPSAEETAIERERRAELRRVLRRLPRRSAAILVMRHGGMSYLEIAEALGIKVGHVGTLLRRAESALRKEIDRETHS